MTAVTDEQELEIKELGHEHADAGTYWIIFGVLAALTAMEVSTYWWPKEWHKGTHIALIIMMVIKFALVALFFMHLKFDNTLLRRTFFFGLALALAVYLVMMSMFQFWDSSGNLEHNYPDPPRSRPVPPPPTVPPPTVVAS